MVWGASQKWLPKKVFSFLLPLSRSTFISAPEASQLQAPIFSKQDIESLLGPDTAKFVRALSLPSFSTLRQRDFYTLAITRNNLLLRCSLVGSFLTFLLAFVKRKYPHHAISPLERFTSVSSTGQGRGDVCPANPIVGNWILVDGSYFYLSFQKGITATIARINYRLMIIGKRDLFGMYVIIQ